MWKGGGGADPAAENDAALHELLVQLDSLLKSERKNFKQIVKVCDQVLGLSPNDPDALICKVTALINSDSIPEALSVIQAAPEADLSFPKAYCLYRLGRYDEVLDLLKGVSNSPGFLQLKAQTYFKLGNIPLCIQAYEALFEEFEIKSNEVKSNAVAAYVAGDRSESAYNWMTSKGINSTALFELAYNSACVSIDRGELSEAEDRLLIASRLGQEAFMENEYTQEEILDELAPVTAQLAYVQQKQGRTAEAMEILLNLLKRDLKEKDLVTIAVVSNNLAALRRNKDASDSLRKLEILLKKDSDGKRLVFAEALQQKFSAAQKEAVVYNYFLLLLSSNKLNQARELLPSIVEEYSESSLPVLLKACLSLKEGKLESAEEILGAYSEAKSEALLLCAQARSTAGHFLEAAEALERLTEVKHMPGIVATLVDLKERGGDVKGAEETLVSAVEWWENNMQARGDILELLTQQAAGLKLRNGDSKGAGEFYGKLMGGSLGVEAITGLICCCAEQAEVEKAESLRQQLPPLDLVDVEKLERRSGEEIGRQAVQVQEKGGDGEDERKKKRKRKPRYPKGFDPENPGPPPNPERWLPRRERSDYRPSKKERRAAHLRGSQGAASRDSAANTTVTSSAANGPSTSKPAAPPGLKNKKKGRR